MIQIVAYSVVFLFTFGVAVATAAFTWRWLESGGAHETPGDRKASGGLLKTEVLSTLSLLSQVLRRVRLIRRLRVLLEEAEVQWTPGRAVLLMFLLAAVGFNLVYHLPRAPLFAAWLLSLAGLAAPVLYLRWRRDRRLRQVEEQLPDGLDFLSRALLSGHSLPLSLELVADEVGPPLAGELRKTVDEYNLGLPLHDALDNLAERLPTVDMRFFVSAVSTQTRTGGNLHEILDGLAETVRDRESLRGRIRALTANGRLTAIILSLMPMVLAGIMMLTNSRYLEVLIDHPLGPVLLLAAFGGQVLAFFIIRRIVDVKV